MKYTFVFLVLVALTLSATAQTPPENSSDGELSAAKKVDPQLHADAIKLVEVSGAKQYLQENLENSIDEAEKMMMDKCPDCSPEFGKEWKKRFLERTKLADYLDVYVRVYEKYLNDSEIKELIALKEDTTKTVVPSTQLKEKLTAVMPSLMAEMMGECAKIGAKLGGEVGQEIEREHPEYKKSQATSTKPDAT